MSKRVLLVDDDQAWLKLAAQSLLNAGYSVLEARDATQALHRAEGADLGLIVLDLNLAGESGLILMKFLKRNYPEVPILLCTALDHDDTTIRSMLDMGADQYIHKGSIEELLVTVGMYLQFS